MAFGIWMTKARFTVQSAPVVRPYDMDHIREADRSSDADVRCHWRGCRSAFGHDRGAVGVAESVVGAAALTTPVGAKVGAVAGGAIGLTADAVTEDHRETAAPEAFFSLKHGQSAVMAEISENPALALYDAVTPLGGLIYRRINRVVPQTAFGEQHYSHDLQP